MKLTRKLTRKRGPAITTCSCYDPIVFWHTPPCPRWESRHNDSPSVPIRTMSFLPRYDVAADLASMQSLVTAMQQLTDTATRFTVTADPGRHGVRGEEEAQD